MFERPCESVIGDDVSMDVRLQVQCCVEHGVENEYDADWALYAIWSSGRLPRAPRARPGVRRCVSRR